jgi:hypothetical protein
VILMSTLGLLPLVFYAFLQVLSPPLLQGDALNAREKARLSLAQKVDDRIKVYHSASTRMQQSVHAAVSGNDFSSVPDALKLWVSLLSGSLEDIGANLKAGKKSKALIRYEIQVRKTITEFRGYKPKAPVEQKDEFDTLLAGAESIRKRFVEIIFR